ncbi:Lrp/AsnC family transcriptional regulator [Streptacidiphilus cavernicola]|uniref:Lrp/AsnC family transcriptional regulator n=1 Tax=Streptacidiphilus cavernicola TaxID=3342716 RepID=A0ABV6W180_9ACTN
MKSRVYDTVDRQLVHALQLDGRAPFSRIGEALGVSDQTVARHYARMRGEGALRVLGLTSPAALGETQWIIRVQCTPDAAASVAEALARRDDTSWVSLSSGGTEINCMTRAESGQNGNSLLLQRLPRTPSVVAVTAYCVLHIYFGGALSLVNKTDTLTPEQAALLLPDPPPPMVTEAVAVELDEADHRMLALLERDGRTGLAELADASGRSQSSVRRRMNELQAKGVLYFDVNFGRRIFGLDNAVLLWLSVSPGQLAETGRAIAEHPEVAFVCATTGPSNLHAVVICPDIPSLYTYLTTRIAALDAVRQLETTPVLRRVKAAASLPQPAAVRGG